MAPPVDNVGASNSKNLAALRKLMAEADSGKGVSAWIVPTEDPHMSEYSPDCFKRRMFISGFAGSAGTAVVTPEQALLWTDGRYFLQAEQELGPEWTLVKAGNTTPLHTQIEDWLVEKLPSSHSSVGIDPFVHTVEAVTKLQAKLKSVGKQLVLLKDNLVDVVWDAAGSRTPAGLAAPVEPLRQHPLQWAGQEVAAKLEGIRKQIRDASADALLVTMLDEVAWLLNVRGSDVECNPVFISYCIVPREGAAVLYVDAKKVPEPIAASLKASGVDFAPYERILPDVAALAAAGKTVWIDPTKVSYALYQEAESARESSLEATPKKRKAANGEAVTAKLFVERPSPIIQAKSVKNDAELAGMREAHLRDAEALCDFFAYLEDHIAAGKVLTEVQVDEQLTQRRAAQPGFVGPSFATIAGAGSNGAVIHYHAHADTCKTVDSDTLLLLDSGGQFDCGTTDITRCVHTGTPTPRQKMAYTRVLQGHIALSSAIFPDGTPGCALDSYARRPLWSEGLNYLHGTGHGVGAALNVHEGPHAVSARFNITAGLRHNMICSNEPGYYEDGAFGIRIENLVMVKEVATANKFGGSYLGFENLTMVPIHTKMIDAALLTSAEVAWLDSYHEQVWTVVSPRLQGKERALEWLRHNTRPLAVQQST